MGKKRRRSKKDVLGLGKVDMGEPDVGKVSMITRKDKDALKLGSAWGKEKKKK